MSLIVDEHRLYLSDEVRVAAYRAAIREVVRDGDVVLDLASGTGILGLLACEAGARRVYAVEIGGMIELARAVARANGLGGRIVAVKGMSTDVDLPERVDAIVCDQIGRFGVEAEILQHAADARERFLGPGGTMLPARIDLMLAAVERPDMTEQVEFWNQRPAGFDFSPARLWAVNTGYPTTIEASALLGPPALLASLDMQSATSAPIDATVRLAVQRPGMLHGLGGWFRAQLSPGVTLTNGPGTSRRIQRRNVFFPIDRPVEVLPGDAIDARVRILPDALMFTWNVDVRRGSQLLQRFRHSTLHGMLLSREDLRCMNPQFVPVLTPRGEARKSVLLLSDGTRPLAAIEAAVFDRHPDLFRSRAEAQAFVIEVLTRYSRISE